MILKMQNGSPFKAVTFQDFSTPAKSGSSSPKKTTTEEKDDADVLELLKTFQKDLIDSALPGDFAYASNQLVKLFTRIENKLENPFLGTGSIASEYVQCIQLVSKLRQNKEDYKKALDTATSKGTLEEYAINSRGHVLVKTNEGITWKNPEQITQSDLLITNQDLLLLRREGAEGMSNSNNYSDIIMGSVGYNQIVETINKTLQNLGSNKYTDGITAYQKAKEENPDISIEEMVNEGIISEDQANQTLQVMSYMWNNLPNNMKSILKINSGEYTENGGFKELTKIVGAKTSKTITAKTIKSGSTKNNVGIEGNKLNLAQMLLADIGANVQLHIRPGSQSGLKINATMLPAQDRQGDPLGITTLDKVINNSVYHPYLMANQISMGNQLIDMAGLSKIVVNGNQLYKVYLPYNVELANRGIIKPDLKFLSILDKVKEEIRNTKATTPSEINAIYEKYELPKYVDENGEVNMQYYKPFVVLNATALSDAFGDKIDSLDNVYLTEIFDKQVIDNNFELIQGKDTKEEFDYKRWRNKFGGEYQQMVKGLVYIPINIDYTLALLGDGSTASFKELDQLRKDQEQEQRINTINHSGKL